MRNCLKLLVDWSHKPKTKESALRSLLDQGLNLGRVSVRFHHRNILIEIKVYKKHFPIANCFSMKCYIAQKHIPYLYFIAMHNDHDFELSVNCFCVMYCMCTIINVSMCTIICCSVVHHHYLVIENLRIFFFSSLLGNDLRLLPCTSKSILPYCLQLMLACFKVWCTRLEMISGSGTFRGHAVHVSFCLSDFVSHSPSLCPVRLAAGFHRRPRWPGSGSCGCAPAAWLAARRDAVSEGCG